MSAADDKQQLAGVIDCLADTVNELSNVDDKLSDVQGSILVLGLCDSNNLHVAGAIALSEQSKITLEILLNHTFTLRQMLTQYRDVL